MPRKAKPDRPEFPYSVRMPTDLHALLQRRKAKGENLSQIIIEALRRYFSGEK